MGTQVTGTVERAEALDRLAEEILVGLSPLEFRPARTAGEVEATLRLRHDAVVERGWDAEAAMADGMERDAFDDVAVPLVCVDDGVVVGTMRLVLPAPGRLLPTEAAFGLRLDPPGSAMDAGRVVVAPSHRGARSHLVMTGLAARAWREGRARGVGRVVGIASDVAVALYEGLGMVVTPLGPPRTHWGEERAPIEIAGAHDPVSFVRPPAAPEPPPDGARGLSRRSLLASAGGVAAGVLLIGVAEAAAQAPRARPAGVGPTDRRSIEFLVQVRQEARDLTVQGWLTHVQGLSPGQLVTGPTPTRSTDPAASDPSTRRLTVVMSARLQSISALGEAITGHGVGRVAIHLLPSGGARLDDPASFASGPAIATFTAAFSHNLAIDAPDRAGTTVGAELVQRGARVFTLGGSRRQLGRPGLPWSLRAAGRGERTDAATPRSQFSLSGDMGVIDAEPA
jgi:N-acyl-L-homoserine lactone synthetase